ncbi:hypothetical protein PoB_000348300 [Plakobranchus ocellatus]|uniref:Uncharacterized protein n=1 Tax=Plakobranchus ocellatus TaxID=259542 RepID=A0AAV3Y3Q0_9GAST|nr:hypothetical protein PoB_000348300 [Plakobranchus ocellatus]
MSMEKKTKIVIEYYKGQEQLNLSNTSSGNIYLYHLTFAFTLNCCISPSHSEHVITHTEQTDEAIQVLVPVHFGGTALIFPLDSLSMRLSENCVSSSNVYTVVY